MKQSLYQKQGLFFCPESSQNVQKTLDMKVKVFYATFYESVVAR